MPDRSLRLPSLLLRERSSSPTPPRESEDTPEQSGQPGRGQGSGPSDDNPFAPPPEGAPDRPWQPRPSAGGQGSEDGAGRGGGHSPWGSQWSDRQPGRSGGPFGERPGGQGGPGDPGKGPEGGPGSGLRWDPADPAQRRARYSLLCGMWAFFFALFAWPYVALLLGSLAVYWAVSALRAKPSTPDPAQPAPLEPSGKPQRTAAISGLVTSTIALAIVAITFTAQFVYRDYYTCVNDSLTTASEKSCKELLPDGPVREMLGTR